MITKILTNKEQEYLKTIIKPFRNKVISITKCRTISKDYVYITIHSQITIINKKESITISSNTALPPFKKNTIFKGLELDIEYTLEELGL